MRKLFTFLFLAVIFAGGIPAVSEAQTATSTASNPPVISKNLYFGLRASNEVMALQSFLVNRGYYNGPVTGNFLGQTLAAVKKFQKANGVPGTGYFGPMSRKVINNFDSVNLSIWPQAPVVAVGENMELKAMYQPPMYCPPGLFCAQVMPAPYEVDATWSSSDPSIAKVEKTVIYCITTPCNPQIRLHGMKEGSATITATYSNGSETMKTSAFVRVVGGTAGTLEIVPTATTNTGLSVGRSMQFTAIYKEPAPACRNSIPACMIAEKAPYPVPVIWSVDNSKVIELVQPTCMSASILPCRFSETTVTGRAPGVARLYAQYELSDSRIVRASQELTVSGTIGTNQPPVIQSISGPQSLYTNRTGIWSIQAYDPEQGNLQYSVDWGDSVFAANQGMAPQYLAAQTTTFSHSYASPGTYTVSIVVRDQSGAEARSSMTVTVSSGGFIF